MSYQIIGNIAILKSPGLVGFTQKAKELLKNPRIETVCKTTGVSGELRQPNITWIAGKKKFTTIHKEHGIRFMVDIRKVMFSKGNLSERTRIAPEIKPNEIIIDMFAGIGYFSLGFAKKAKKVYAIEKNPASFSLLKKNIMLNKLGNVKPINNDCRNPELIKKMEKADRISMGYFPNTEKFLPTAFSLAKNNAIIHYHNSYLEQELWKKPEKEIQKAAKKAGFSIVSMKKKKVKSIAPRTYHIVIDVIVKKGD